MLTDQKLLPCPFCGGKPTVEPWHGGASTKVMICCSNSEYNDEDGGCSVGPVVTGETPDEAARRWNRHATSPQPANPAQVTDAMVEAAYDTLRASLSLHPSRDQVRAALTAAIGAAPKPSLLDRERAAMNVTQRRAIEAEGIADAVLSWMVKYDLLDAGNEYHASDVLAVLNDLAPSAAIGAGGQAVDIVPEGVDGRSLVFAEGVLHVKKDGSGYIAVDEDDWQLEDDRSEGPDGPEGSVHWITRLAASEMQAIRDFLNGAALSQPHPADERVVEALRKAANIAFDEMFAVVGAPVARAVQQKILALSATEGQLARTALADK